MSQPNEPDANTDVAADGTRGDDGTAADAGVQNPDATEVDDDDEDDAA